MAGIDVRVYNQHAFRYAMRSHLSIAYLKAGFVYLAFSTAICMAGYIILCLTAFPHRAPAPSLRERAGGEATYLLPLGGGEGGGAFLLGRTG